jgi:hypothetical protein
VSRTRGEPTLRDVLLFDRRTASQTHTTSSTGCETSRKVVAGGSDLCEFAIIGAADDREVEAAVCGGRKDSLAQVVPPVGVCLAVRTSIQHYFSGLRSPPSPPPPGPRARRLRVPPLSLGVRRPFTTVLRLNTLQLGFVGAFQSPSYLSTTDAPAPNQRRPHLFTVSLTNKC